MLVGLELKACERVACVAAVSAVGALRATKAEILVLGVPVCLTAEAHIRRSGRVQD